MIPQPSAYCATRAYKTDALTNCATLLFYSRHLALDSVYAAVACRKKV